MTNISFFENVPVLRKMSTLEFVTDRLSECRISFADEGNPVLDLYVQIHDSSYMQRVGYIKLNDVEHTSLMKFDQAEMALFARNNHFHIKTV